MAWGWLLLGFVSALDGCGKTASRADSQPSDAGAPSPSGATGSGGEGGSTPGEPGGGGALSGAGGEETCFDTPREPEDDAVNAETLEMMALTPPDRAVPVTIVLVRIQTERTNGETTDEYIARRKQLLAPYQAPIEQRLQEAGASDVSAYWITNAVSAKIPARRVPAVLCWPNVVEVEVDAAFWTIAEPPWSEAEAGPAECPLVDGHCYAHCFEVIGLPAIDGVACWDRRTTVTCSREQYGIDDDEPVCRQRVDTGEQFVFRGIVPDAPDYLGFRRCDEPAPEYFDECAGGQGPT